MIEIVHDPQAFFEIHLPYALSKCSDEPLPEDVAVAFHIQGDGGGSWQVARGEGDSLVGPVGEGPKDCVVRCTSQDFMDIVSGAHTARDLFFRGRLHVVGDIGLAMRLEKILPTAA